MALSFFLILVMRIDLRCPWRWIPSAVLLFPFLTRKSRGAPSLDRGGRIENERDASSGDEGARSQCPPHVIIKRPDRAYGFQVRGYLIGTGPRARTDRLRE